MISTLMVDSFASFPFVRAITIFNNSNSPIGIMYVAFGRYRSGEIRVNNKVSSDIHVEGPADRVVQPYELFSWGRADCGASDNGAGCEGFPVAIKRHISAEKAESLYIKIMRNPNLVLDVAHMTMMTREAANQAAAAGQKSIADNNKLINQVFNLLQTDQIAAAENLIKQGCPLNGTDKDGNTFLHITVLKGLSPLTELLINKGININAKNSAGNTPLHIAAQTNNKELAQVLVSKGANPELKNYQGQTPFELTTAPEIQNILKPHEEKPVIEQKLKEQGLQMLDYDQARDFTDILKAYEHFDDQQLKFLHVEKRSEIMSKVKEFYGIMPEQLKESNKPGSYSTIKVLRSANNELIGTVVCKYERDAEGINMCDLANIFITTKYQGKGLGKDLMQIGMEFFAKLGCKDITLQVHPENTKAKALYEKLGFKEVTRTSNNVYMQKMLK